MRTLSFSLSPSFAFFHFLFFVVLYVLLFPFSLSIYFICFLSLPFSFLLIFLLSICLFLSQSRLRLAPSPHMHSSRHSSSPFHNSPNTSPILAVPPPLSFSLSILLFITRVGNEPDRFSEGCDASTRDNFRTGESSGRGRRIFPEVETRNFAV